MKRLSAFLLILTLVTSVFFIDLVHAAGIIDYKERLAPEDIGYYKKPLSGLRLYIKRQTGVNQNLDSTDEYKIGQAKAGDRVEARDISALRSPLATNVNRWDFQYVKPDGTEVVIDKAGTQYGLIQEIILDQPGKWEFYLSVRDNAHSSLDPYWDNWSDNGSHRAIKDLGNGQKFYWYFVRMDIQVEDNSKPVAEFEIHHLGANKTDNYSSPVEVEKYPIKVQLLDRSYVPGNTKKITRWHWEYSIDQTNWSFFSNEQNPTFDVSDPLTTFRLKVYTE